MEEISMQWISFILSLSVLTFPPRKRNYIHTYCNINIHTNEQVRKQNGIDQFHKTNKRWVKFQCMWKHERLDAPKRQFVLKILSNISSPSRTSIISLNAMRDAHSCSSTSIDSSIHKGLISTQVLSHRKLEGCFGFLWKHKGIVDVDGSTIL